MDVKDIVKLLEGLRAHRKDPRLLPEELDALRGAIGRLRDFEALQAIAMAAFKWAKQRPVRPEDPAAEKQLRKLLEEFKACKAVESFNAKPGFGR